MVRPDFTARLAAWIRKHKLFTQEDILLCAVSGGLDSMVLAHALHAMGFSLEIAHVNFGLRGEESEKDAELVHEWARKRSLPFHLKRAENSMEKMQGSLQERARNFRYGWLESLAASRQIPHLVLGHHADDQTETLLLQYFRGAGTSGMLGMSPSSGIRRRPLLGFTRKEIAAYATAEGIIWREDASNQGDAYLRNRIRHHLVPMLSELFPGFESVLERNSARMHYVSGASNFLFQDLYSSFLKAENPDFIEFRLDQINLHPMAEFFISGLMLKNEFTFSDAQDLISGRNSTEGRLKKNAGGIAAELRFPRLLLWKNASAAATGPIEISADDLEEKSWPLYAGKKITLRFDSEKPLASGPGFWQQALEGIVFPLCLRSPKPGDRIRLSGMGGKSKKLSDLFSESARTAEEKKRSLILEDGNGKILWIPGLRAADYPSPHRGSGKIWIQLELQTP